MHSRGEGSTPPQSQMTASLVIESSIQQALLGLPVLHPKLEVSSPQRWFGTHLYVAWTVGIAFNREESLLQVMLEEEVLM